MGSILDLATGWTLYGALIAATGGCVARAVLIPRASGAAEAPPELHAAAGRLALFGALLLPLALGLFFLRQLLEFRDPFVPWTEDADLLLTGTAWGTTWLWGVAGSIVALIGLGLAARGSRAGWLIGGAAVLALGAFPAFTGHANGSDGPRLLTLGADTLHMWAAGAWIGGLAFVLYAERGWRRTAADSLLPTLVPAFSPVAVTCVALLVATGTVGAWVHVPSVPSLFTSPYGRRLLLKLALVAVVLGLGFLNWRKLTPMLGTPEGSVALRRAATVELLVAQAVLLVTAILVRTGPPME